MSNNANSSGGSSPSTSNSGSNNQSNGNDSNASSDVSNNQQSTDISFNYVLSVSNSVHDVSSVICVDDLSANPFGLSLNNPFDLSMVVSELGLDQITHNLSTSTNHGLGYDVTTSYGLDASNAYVTNVTFTTTDASGLQIYENLTEIITTYDDETYPTSQTDILLNQIQSYADQIQCSDFHGKGTIDDYTALFEAAGRIATDSKQIELNIDIEGFNEFASAADDLSALFSGFILKLQNVNIITDVTFLTAVSSALSKIVNLSNVFGRFKQAIFDTTTIQIPKSAHDTTVIIEGVMAQVNCAMNYVNYFVDPTINPSLIDAALTASEKNIIAQSVKTIDNWNTLCEYGVSIAMTHDPDIQYIQNASNTLKHTTASLKTATSTLKAKLAAFNIVC
jgi:hypothetical protein